MQAYFEINREFDKKISFITNRDADCDPHFHSNIEILYVVSGCVEVTVRELTRRLSAGSMAVAAGYEPHGFHTVGHSEVNVFLFPSEEVPDFTARTVEGMFRSPFLENSARHEELSFVMQRLSHYVDKEVTLAARGYMYTALGILQDELGFCRKTDSRQSELLIRRLLVYIEEHFREALTLSAMAKQFGYHKDYLSKIFNDRIGCGFNAYVNLLRTRYARHQIDTVQKSLDEIGAESGFRCMKSFRRAFCHYYGQTPYEYRLERTAGRA